MSEHGANQAWEPCAAVVEATKVSYNRVATITDASCVPELMTTFLRHFHGMSTLWGGLSSVFCFLALPIVLIPRISSARCVLMS